MSREIKFRAWDINPESQRGNFIYIDLSGNLTVNGEWALNNLEEFQQYTGLKDKNGVEIYEGDIVRRGTGYTFEMKLNEFSLGGAGYSVAYGYNHREDDEVIGNIYENPELLESK